MYGMTIWIWVIILIFKLALKNKDNVLLNNLLKVNY